MNHSCCRVAVMVLFAGILGLHAESLNPLLQNPSFEEQEPFQSDAICSAPCFNYSVQHWNQPVGTSGTLNPSLSPAAQIAAFSGQNVAFLYAGGSINQDLGPLSTNQPYSVSVALAARQDTGPVNFKMVVASLGDGTYQVTGTALPSVWTIVTLVFTLPQVFPGVTYPASFSVTNTDLGGRVLLVDATPEPASALLALVGTCLIAFGRACLFKGKINSPDAIRF